MLRLSLSPPLRFFQKFRALLKPYRVYRYLQLILRNAAMCATGFEGFDRAKFCNNP